MSSELPRSKKKYFRSPEKLSDPEDVECKIPLTENFRPANSETNGSGLEVLREVALIIAQKIKFRWEMAF